MTEADMFVLVCRCNNNINADISLKHIELLHVTGTFLSSSGVFLYIG